MPQLTEPNQVGKREDLSDLISNVDACETPVTSMLTKGPKPENTMFDWQADNYDTPSTSGVVDGADVSTFQNKAQNRARLYARIQRQWRPWKVSHMAEQVSNVAGVKSEKAAAIVKSMTELKRDIEVVVCSDNESQADNGTVPYLTRGLGKWITNSAQSDLPVPEAYRTPTASLDNTAMASLTEAILQGVLQSVWTQTGQKKRYALFCGPDFQRAVTDMTKVQTGVSSSISAIRTYNQDATKGQIYATVDMFVGDFGELELLPSKWLAYETSNAADHRAYLLDMSKVRMRVAQAPGSVPLQNAGGGERGYVDAIYGLQCDNPLAHGKFYATS